MNVIVSRWTAHHNQLIYSILAYCDLNSEKLKIEYNSQIPNTGAVLEYTTRRIFFDYSDSAEFIASSQNFDFYFKRSLLNKDYKNNVHPLNFQVNFAYKPLKLIRKMPFKILVGNDSRAEVLRALDLCSLITKDSHRSKDISNFKHGKNITDNGGRILFMTRLWDPSKNNDPDEKERRRVQNEFRINACRIIRKNYPNSIAGLYPDKYAQSVAPDCLLKISDTRKSKYLKYLSTSDICIADDGLKDTPGWKIGEYALMNKAIITTPISTVVSNFSEGKNYFSLESRKDYLGLPKKIDQMLRSKHYMSVKGNNKIWSEDFLVPHKYVEYIIGIVEAN